MYEYIVTYLEHSIFHDAIKKTETLTQAQLVALLQRGLISVLEARIK